MKKKSALIFGLVLVILLSFGSGVVFSQTSKEPPRVTTACETKIGGMLFGMNDGFSTLKKCPGNSRKVILGEANQSENKQFGNDDIAFMDYDYSYSMFYVLLGDGTAWTLNPNDNNWVQDTKRTLPNVVTIADISFWKMTMFSTKNGDLWVSRGTHEGNPEMSGWINMGKGGDLRN